jgi:hypothetical protein
MTDVNLNLEEEIIPAVSAQTKLLGGVTWNTTAGGRVHIRTKESAEADIDNVLDETTPVGKKWTVHVVVTITETDA